MMMQLILKHKELAEISQLKQRAAIIRWLKRNGVPHILDANGNPITTEAQLDESLSGGKLKQTVSKFRLPE